MKIDNELTTVNFRGSTMIHPNPQHSALVSAMTSLYGPHMHPSISPPEAAPSQTNTSPTGSSSSFRIDDILRTSPNSSSSASNSLSGLAKPTPINPAALHASGVLTAPSLYKPMSMYDHPMLPQSPYLPSHMSYTNAFMNHMYPMPYMRPEYALLDRHHAFSKGIYFIFMFFLFSHVCVCMIFIILFNSPFFKIMHCRTFNGNQIKRKKTQILIFYFGLFFFLKIFTIVYYIKLLLNKLLLTVIFNNHLRSVKNINV